MTVQASLSASNSEMEYLLAIEGIGWPADEADFSAGFIGTIFATADLNGDLASLLGCTVRKGLRPFGGIGDEFNPRTGEYSGGHAEFTVIDLDGFLLANITPAKTTGTESSLSSALAFDATTVVLVDQFAEDEIVWIAGREAVLLGTESGAGPYTYTGSSRGYLGTPRSRGDARPTGATEFTWEAGTSVLDFNKIWYDRRVIAMLHVPGEAATKIVRVFHGKTRPLKSSNNDTLWKFPAAQDTTTRISEIRRAKTNARVGFTEFVDPEGKIVRGYSTPATASGLDSTPGSGDNYNKIRRLSPDVAASARRAIIVEPGSNSWGERLVTAAAYNYRNRVPGGTAGMRNAVVTDYKTPQAFEDADGRKRLDTYVMVDGNYMEALHQRIDFLGGTGDHPFNEIMTEVTSYTFDSNYLDLFFEDGEIRFLLDNYQPDTTSNRFTVNNEIRFNPIDVFLIFATSMNNEYKIFDATGGTASVLTFPSVMVVDQWIGYALHCVEGVNLGEARVISDNTATDVSVDRPFSNAPGVGDEYQIRNTIYDVLPLSWGRELENFKIDIESFEDVRDKYLADARIGNFALGSEDELNLWRLLVDNLLIPYGVLGRVDRATGKYSAVYVGNVTLDDGIEETYVSVEAKNILDLSDITDTPRPPLAGIELTVRDPRTIAIRPKRSYHPDSPWFARGEGPIEYEEEEIVSPGVHGKGVVVPFVAGEKDLSFDLTGLERLPMTAMFNTKIDVNDFLAVKMLAKVAQEVTPPPECRITLDAGFILTAQAGTLLSINDTTNRNPRNPFTGERGWTNMIARVLGSSVGSQPPTNECRIQLLSSLTGGLIAPAADVDSKGSDAGGAYFVVHFGADTADYSIDRDTLDWRGFRVDDRIELRDITGALKEGPEVIKGFGSGLATLPSGAANGRIYIDGTISSSIVAGDYITFSPWTGSNTANMNNFAAYGDSNKTLTGGDDARKYF